MNGATFDLNVAMRHAKLCSGNPTETLEGMVAVNSWDDSFVRGWLMSYINFFKLPPQLNQVM